MLCAQLHIFLRFLSSSFCVFCKWTFSDIQKKYMLGISVYSNIYCIYIYMIELSEYSTYPFFYKLQHTAKHRFNTLKLRNGTKICLNVEDEDTVEQADAMTDAMETVTHRKFEIGGFADKASRLIKGMKEHRLRFKRLEVPVAPVAFRLETILGVVLFYWFMLFYVVLFLRYS